MISAASWHYLCANRSSLSRGLQHSVEGESPGQQGAALQDLGFSRSADCGGWTSDRPVKRVPVLLQGIWDGTGTDISYMPGQSIDKRAADSEFLQLHSGETNDSRAGLVGNNETHFLGANVAGF